VRNLVVVAVSFVALFNVACSGNDRPAQSDESVDSTEATDDAGSSANASSLSSENVCDQEHVGCPCTNEGAVFSCGHVKRTVGTYTSCVEEFSTCQDGIWSKCGGTQQ
jgi:hypothetical protein